MFSRVALVMVRKSFPAMSIEFVMHLQQCSDLRIAGGAMIRIRRTTTRTGTGTRRARTTRTTRSREEQEEEKENEEENEEEDGGGRRAARTKRMKTGKMM